MEALFIDALHRDTMRMQREGVANDTIASVLVTALGLLITGEKPDARGH